MSFTPGQLVGAVIGAAVGFFTFNPLAGYSIYAAMAMGASIGMSIGGIIDPPEGQTIKQEGARLGDLNVQTSEWGTPIRRLFGTYKMSGNIIWALDLHETKHVEESGEGKGGGGTKTETTWYSYAGSWAVGFCEGEVSGIKKVWFDSVLVYDNSNYSGGLTYSNHTIYLGTSTQEIDWYIQSKNSDTPAYRNLCYIVFNTIELENYGNKIPKVSVEIVKDGSLKTIEIESSTVLATTVSTQYSWCLNPKSVATAALYTTDLSAKKFIYPNIIAPNDSNLNQIWRRSYTISYDGVTQAVSFREWQVDLGYFAHTDGGGVNFWGGSLPDGIHNSTDQRIFLMDGKVYVMYQNDIDYKYQYLIETIPMNIDNPPDSEPTSILLLDRPMAHILKYYNGYILLGHDDTITLLDFNFNEVKSFAIDPVIPFHYFYTGGNGMAQLIDIEDNKLYAANIHSTDSGWSFFIIDIVDETIDLIGEIGQTTSVYNLSKFNTFALDGNIIYNANMQLENPSWNIFRLGGIDSNQVTVGSIVSELLLRAGFDQLDFNVDEGVDLVNGYVIPNPMDTRSAISTIISAYKFDLIESDSQLILKKRDPLNIIATIEEDKVVDFVEIDRLQTVELSRAINIVYANKDNNYDIGTQSAFRNDSNTETTKTYQYPLAFNDNEAKQIAEVYLYTEWSERLKFKFSLPIEYINLIPTNIINIGSNGKVFTVRLTKIDQATNKQLNCEASLESPTVYESISIGSDTGSVDYTVDIQGPTNFELLDIPMLDNLYNKEGIYIAADGYLDNWNGCGIDKSIDAKISYSSIGTIINSTLLGQATTVLSSGNTTIWDLTNSVTVSIINGSLYDNSMESVLNGNGYLLVGSEIIQYMDSTDNGDGTFLLENLLRGRRGTEWSIGAHIIGERVVSLSSNMMFDSTASLNVNSYYKATTFGDFIEDSTAEYIVPEIICLKPLSSSYLKGERDGSNNLTISWNRRSRDVTGYLKTLQLFEETESYEIHIVDADVPTFYTSDTESYIYSDTDQLADNNSHSSGDPVSVIIYQISGTVGQGYGTEGVI